MFSDIISGIGHAFSSIDDHVGNIFAKASPIIHTVAPIVTALAPELAPAVSVIQHMTSDDGRKTVSKIIKRKAQTMLSQGVKKLKTSGLGQTMHTISKAYDFINEL